MRRSPVAIHVGLVHWTWAPTTGGVETHLLDLARAVTERGLPVTVITGEPSPLVPAGVDVVSIPDMDLRRVRAEPRLRSTSAADCYREPLRSAIVSRGLNVIHGHNLHHFSPGPALVVEELRREMSLRTFHTFHETWPDVLAHNPVYVGWDASFAVSEHVQRECARRLGFAPTLLRLGVDLERFRASDPRGAESVRILHPGRLLPWKGVHVSVEMLAQVRRAGIDAVLTLTDTPRIADWDAELDSYRRRIVALARARRVLDHVELITPTFDELPAIYAAADIVVYPTVGEEPYGLVPLEAMASGRPIVATRSGGMVETVVDGTTGLLVEPNDAAALARAVEQLARDPARREAMGIAGRKHVEAAFDARAYVSELLRHYRRGHPAPQEPGS